MSDLLSWIVPLTLTGLVGAVAWIVKLAIELTNLKKDNESQTKELDRLSRSVEESRDWNRLEHEKLFDSRNTLTNAVTELATTLREMDKKVDEILRREIARNGNGSH